MGNFSGWFRGIKGRLFFAALLPVFGYALIFVVSDNGFEKMAAAIHSAHKELIPNLTSLGSLKGARNKFGFDIWNALNSTTTEEKENYFKSAHGAIDAYEASYKDYSDNKFMPDEQKLFNDIKNKFPELIALMRKTEALAEGAPEKQAEAKNILLHEMPALADQLGAYNNNAFKIYTERAHREDLESQKTQNFVFNMILLITLMTTFLSFGVIIWVSTRISNAVSKIAENLKTSSAQVTDAVTQLNEAGNGLSQSSTQGAASLEETAAALEEMSSMVQMNSDHAKQAAALSTTSRDSAESWQNEIKSLILSVNEISKSSKKIEEIISVIDDIAFQTNLLALNAAVEAARAGEQGKGFTVVAEAVRALAQRSASSAKDISSLIKDSVMQIAHGSKIADQSGILLANIVTSIKKVSDLNQEIAAASSEQTTGIQQISKAMNQLDQTSQSNAASTEEITATTGEISNLSHRTENLTAELKILILGAPSPATKNTGESTIAPPSSRPVFMQRRPNKTTPHASSASTTKKASVHTLRPKNPSPKQNIATSMIPFDEDDRAKVGTTDGF